MHLLKRLQKRLVQGIEAFLKEAKTKIINMLLNNIEIFLKKKKTKSVNTIVNTVKIFLKMENKGYLECQKMKTS